MFMHTGRRVVIDDIYTARHAEMDHRATVACVDQQILGPPTDGGHCLTGEFVFDVGADRPTQASFANNNVVDALADEIRLDAAAAGFDFGKLRHAA